MTPRTWPRLLVVAFAFLVPAGGVAAQSDDCAGGVPVQSGFLYDGPDPAQIPFGEGLRCVAAGGSGIFRLNPPVAMDGAGNVQRALDFTLPRASSGPGAILPGSTWRFQLWYRDPSGGPSGFDLSNGLEANICR